MIYPPITYTPAPDDDDFDERLDGQREAEREGGTDGGTRGAPALSLSPEEER